MCAMCVSVCECVEGLMNAERGELTGGQSRCRAEAEEAASFNGILCVCASVCVVCACVCVLEFSPLDFPMQ